MDNNLYHAEKQWANRPADQRFWDLESMTAACKAYADAARGATVHYSELRTEAGAGEVYLVGKQESRARLTSWSFGQLAQRAGAPAAYLRKLPATLAAQNINHGFKTRGEARDDRAKALLHINGDLVVRGFTGVGYSRIWNWEVGARLLALPGNWRTPPALVPPDGEKLGMPTKVATAEDCLPGMSWVNPGATIAPAGIYASPHDMWVFLVNTEREVDTGLFRGTIIWNSEVGAKSIGGLSFLFNTVCGNHIIYGAQHVTEFRFRHVGKARERAFQQMALDVRAYMDSSVDQDRARIRAARTYTLGAKKEDILDTLFKVTAAKKLSISRATLEAAVDHAAQGEQVAKYGDPTSVWAVSNSLSELSHQTIVDAQFADQRFDKDRAAGRLMEIAF